MTAMKLLLLLTAAAPLQLTSRPRCGPRRRTRQRSAPDEDVAWEAATADLEAGDWAPDATDLILEAEDALVWVMKRRGACLDARRPVVPF